MEENIIANTVMNVGKLFVDTFERTDAAVHSGVSAPPSPMLLLLLLLQQQQQQKIGYRTPAWEVSRQTRLV